MKDSGIEWIAEIPKEWEIKRIKYVAEFEPKCNMNELNNDSIVTYLPMECLKNGYFEKRERNLGDLPTSLTHFQENDIVMAKVTPCFENGNIAIMQKLQSGFGLGSSELFVLRCKTVNIHYLFWWLQNRGFVSQACSTMTGTGGLKRVSPYFIKNCTMHMPPEIEQVRISNFLYAQCEELDNVHKKTCASIEEYKKLKQAVITQAVTKGLHGDREMKDSENKWAREIPSDIKISRVGLHYEIILGKMLCTNQIDDTYTYEPYFCAADIHFEGIAENERKKMWFSPLEKQQYLVRKDDLLVVEGGAGAGGCTVAPIQEVSTYIQNSIMIVRPGKSADVRYLKYWIECLVKQGYIDVVCNKATIPHFTKDKLANVPFLVFSLQEQEEIANYLDQKCSAIDELIAKKEQYLSEIENYKKTLIYEYVTGKKEVPQNC